MNCDKRLSAECRHKYVNKCVGGVTVSMVAFQAVDPGSTPGRRTFVFFWRSLQMVLLSSERKGNTSKTSKLNDKIDIFIQVTLNEYQKSIPKRGIEPRPPR